MVAGGILVAAFVLELLATFMTVSLLDPPRGNMIVALGAATDAFWDKFLKQLEGEESTAFPARYWLPTFRILRTTDKQIFGALKSHLLWYQHTRGKRIPAGDGNTRAS